MKGIDRTKRVLFICHENCNRSQMAEAFARIYGGAVRRQLSFPFSDNYLSPPHPGVTLRWVGLAQRREPERSEGDRSGARPTHRHDHAAL